MRHSHGLFILVNLILSIFVDHNLLNPFHYLSNSITSPKGVDALYVY
ncbi:hypothetical protein ES288_D01G272200v1 [Gossypium darwinii]|uniref:Uncharacterized protein n=1 Tax=Gossypium darwinii TaxID=34276 RepID=A0A5D2DUT1_GOSDA|nr:hypothetical protein ES288_D01G272200v1 [Gossypium darwinii]